MTVAPLQVSWYAVMASSMAFFCAELPSPLMVPVGQSVEDPFVVVDPVALAPEEAGEFASEPQAVKLAARTRQAGTRAACTVVRFTVWSLPSVSD